MPDTPVRVGLAGDDEAHRILLQRLADDSTLDLPDIQGRRSWVGDDAGQSFLSTGQRPRRPVAPSGRPVYRSQRYGDAPRGYAAVFVEAVQKIGGRADVTLVLVDEDGDSTRVHAAAMAASILANSGGPPTVLGVCNPCAEGWLVGMIGRARPERLARLETALATRLANHPERLTSKPATSAKNAKRALHFLLDDEHQDPMRYPANTPPKELTEPALGEAAGNPRAWASLRGCGLSAFFEQLCANYAPLLRA